MQPMLTLAIANLHYRELTAGPAPRARPAAAGVLGDGAPGDQRRSRRGRAPGGARADLRAGCAPAARRRHGAARRRALAERPPRRRRPVHADARPRRADASARTPDARGLSAQPAAGRTSSRSRPAARTIAASTGARGAVCAATPSIILPTSARTAASNSSAQGCGLRVSAASAPASTSTAAPSVLGHRLAGLERVGRHAEHAERGVREQVEVTDAGVLGGDRAARRQRRGATRAVARAVTRARRAPASWRWMSWAAASVQPDSGGRAVTSSSATCASAPDERAQHLALGGADHGDRVGWEQADADHQRDRAAHPGIDAAAPTRCRGRAARAR